MDSPGGGISIYANECTKQRRCRVSGAGAVCRSQREPRPAPGSWGSREEIKARSKRSSLHSVRSLSISVRTFCNKSRSLPVCFPTNDADSSTIRGIVEVSVNFLTFTIIRLTARAAAVASARPIGYRQAFVKQRARAGKKGERSGDRSANSTSTTHPTTTASRQKASRETEQPTITVHGLAPNVHRTLARTVSLAAAHVTTRVTRWTISISIDAYTLSATTTT